MIIHEHIHDHINGMRRVWMQGPSTVLQLEAIKTKHYVRGVTPHVEVDYTARIKVKQIILISSNIANTGQRK